MDYTKRYNTMTVKDLMDVLDMYKRMYGPTTKVSVYAGKDLCQRNVLDVQASSSGINIFGFDTWSNRQDEHNPDWFKEDYEKDQRE